jgi:hypothetical protein
MDVNRTSRIAIVSLLLAILAPLATAQARRSSYDPGSQKPSKPKEGFIDFTLQRINSSDKNFGQCVDETRRILLQESIENGYFWSNVAALGLLGCLFTIIAYQHKLQARREWTAAEMLGQYEHALSRSNAQVDEATKRNHGLMEALTVLRESALRAQPLAGATQDRPAVQNVRSRTSSTQAGLATPPKNGGTASASDRSVSAARATEPVNQIGLFKPDVDLIMKVNSLEQQLGRSQDEAKLLRRQLSEADRRFQGEQQKNRALKGE